MIAIKTAQPAALLEKLRAAASDESENGLAFWYLDDDGDFGYLPDTDESDEPVEDEAWLRAVETREDQLTFEVIWPEGLTPDRGIYAFLQSQFIEMLLAVFPQDFEYAAAYPLT